MTQSVSEIVGQASAPGESSMMVDGALKQLFCAVVRWRLGLALLWWQATREIINHGE